MLTFSKMTAQDHNQNTQCTDLSQIPFYLHSFVFSSIQFYHIIVFVSPKHTECLQYHKDPFSTTIPTLPLTPDDCASVLHPGTVPSKKCYVMESEITRSH